MLGVHRRLVLLLSFGLLAAGCLGSPTLPLPPPAPDQPTVPVDGQTRLTGNVPVNNIGVRVLALNARSNMIYGQSTSTNRFSFLADAMSGDTFVIWYTVGDEESDSVEVTVPYGPSTPNTADPNPPDAGDAG